MVHWISLNHPTDRHPPDAQKIVTLVSTSSRLHKQRHNRQYGSTNSSLLKWDFPDMTLGVSQITPPGGTLLWLVCWFETPTIILTYTRFQLQPREWRCIKRNTKSSSCLPSLLLISPPTQYLRNFPSYISHLPTFSSNYFFSPFFFVGTTARIHLPSDPPTPRNFPLHSVAAIRQLAEHWCVRSIRCPYFYCRMELN